MIPGFGLRKLDEIQQLEANCLRAKCRHKYWSDIRSCLVWTSDPSCLKPLRLIYGSNVCAALLPHSTESTKSDEFWSAKGGGSFSIQKFILQILGALNRAFWSWNWYKICSNFKVQGMLFSTIVLYYNCITPISGNHVHAFHTIQPSYLLAYMQPYLS